MPFGALTGKAMKRIFALIAVTAVMSAARVSAQTWVPPVGIPAPAFGINEVAPPAPSPWTSPVPGFYYVEPTHSSSTDSSNAYGTPARPRKTIPTYLTAGSVVELRGTYATYHRSPAAFSLQGTASQPVFIRGKSTSERATATQPWAMTGQYFIVENIDFTVDRQTLLVAPIYRGVLRYSTMTGTAASISAIGPCFISPAA